jgi:hypothetical protein
LSCYVLLKSMKDELDIRFYWRWTRELGAIWHEQSFTLQAGIPMGNVLE